MKNTAKFIIHDFDYRPYATLNHDVLSREEIEAIADWCEGNGCTYYGMGLVEFPNQDSVTLFLLRWS